MKKIITILSMILLSIAASSQSKEDKELNKLLLSGSINPTSYSIGGVEQLEYTKEMSIVMREDYYEIKITGTNDSNTYFIFKIKNTRSKGGTIEGQISDISLDVNDWLYVCDKAHGSIEARAKEVKIEIETNDTDSATKYTIGFEIKTNDDFRAEEFLAEVFFGDMTPKSPKVYIEKETNYPYFFSQIPDEKDDIFELPPACWEEDIAHTLCCWDKNAPIFQLPKYKRLIIVEKPSRLSGEQREKMRKRQFSKPLFSKNGNYALIEITYNSYYRTGYKWSWKKFMFIKHYAWEYNTTQYLYKRIDGNWVQIYSRMTEIT